MEMQIEPGPQTRKVSEEVKNRKGKKKGLRLIIRFNLKKTVPKGMRLGKEVANFLDKVVKERIKMASNRAKANKRTTILPQDL